MKPAPPVTTITEPLVHSIGDGGAGVDVTAMRRIDAIVGPPLCAVVGTLHRLWSRGAPHRPPPPRHVVIIKLAEQGATVVAHGALVRLTERVGREHVQAIVFAENRPILDELDVLDPERVLTVRTSGPLRFAIDVLRVTRRCRRRGVDTALDLEGLSHVGQLLAFLTGAGRRVGLHPVAVPAGEGRSLHTHLVVANPRLHAAEQFAALVDAAFRDPDDLPSLAPAGEGSPPPAWRAEPADLARVERDVRDRLPAGADGPIVLLNVNAGDLLPQRRWPADRYRDLALRLLDSDERLAVVFIGAPSEASDVDRVTASVASPRAISMAGRTTLHDLLVLFELADVLVTNDSGPAHFATMTSIHAVVLFGPESPEIFGPRTSRSVALWAGLPCSPCVNVLNGRTTACTDNQCLQSIAVDDVLDCVNELLASRRDRSPIAP
jgi:ADP-heptose:LPS heptosyltransferase